MPGHNTSDRLLVLMAKQPRPGYSKTRLAPPLTETQAADLYRSFLVDKIAQMRQVSGVECAIAYTPPGGRATFADLAPGFSLIEQKGPDLSARLTNVFADTFAAGYGQVMAIDGDTPTLPPDYLRRGFAALDSHAADVVLGPCEDGGYYAIGMREPHLTLFNVTMSTPHVMRDTLARAEDAGLSVHCLPRWWDVDRPADLARLQEALHTRSIAPMFAAPATRRMLSAIQQTEV